MLSLYRPDVDSGGTAEFWVAVARLRGALASAGVADEAVLLGQDRWLTIAMMAAPRELGEFFDACERGGELAAAV